MESFFSGTRTIAGVTLRIHPCVYVIDFSSNKKTRAIKTRAEKPILHLRYHNT